MSDKTGQLPTSLGQTLGKADFAQRPMSLRKFLEPFDHSSLADADAGEKYASYKASFAKQQLEDFFEKHKNHAWFREKYHPDIRSDPSINQKLCQRRLDIFMDLHKQGVLDKIALHNGNEAAIVKFLDTVAVKLAGGTDEDVRFLDEFKYTNSTPKVPISTQASQRSKVQRNRREIETDTGDVAKDTGKVDDDAKHKSRSQTRASTDRRIKPKPKKQKQNRKNMEKKHSKEVDERLSRSPSGDSERSQSRSASASQSSSSSSSSSSSDQSSSSSSDDDDDSSSSSDSNSQSESSSSESGSSSRSSSSASSRSRSGSETARTNPDEDRPISKSATRKRNSRVSRGRDSSARSSSGGDGDESPRGRIPRKKGEDRRSKRSSTRPVNQGDADLNQTGLLISEPGAETRTVNASQQPDATAYQDEEHVGPPVVHRRPIHHTSVLYFPHIPINVYQKDIIGLLSTSPLFIRFAVLDPCVMPASDKVSQSNEPLFDPDVDSSSSPGIALRRVGWASFAAQTIDPATDKLTEVDLETIKTNLIQQATEAQAPAELVDCLRLSRPLPDPMRRPPTDRVRSTGPALLTSILLKHCPSRLYSKGVLRRHLVMAARLAYEFDKARGLWTTDKELLRNGAPVVTDPLVNEVNTGLDAHSHNDSSLLEQNCSTDILDGADEVDENQDQDDDQVNKQEKPVRSAPTSASVVKNDTIDPGEDLVSAATMLGMLVSENPLLNGLTDYLVDEGNAEEELLLSGGFQAMSFLPGIAVPVGVGAPAIPCADNTEMLQVLDRIILYLRVVHSVDFYAPALYVNEDAMPHPCQMLHVRPSKAQLNKALSRFIPQGTEHPSDTSSQETLFANQLRRMIRLVRPLTESDCVKLGLRDVEEVVEAFVKANTRRKKRKTDVIWVCPLSDKKFRDPIYVKKHIMNKHLEKVEAVKKDTAFFFNNYLLDPMRPQLPLEPRLPNKRRRSRSRAESKQRQQELNNVPTHPNNNNRERSGTDQSNTQRWYGARRFRDDNTNARPFYPSNPFGRDYGSSMGTSRPYGRMPNFQPRLPFHSQRGRYFGSGSGYTGVRHGFQRRPYVDLDAP